MNGCLADLIIECRVQNAERRVRSAGTAPSRRFPTCIGYRVRSPEGGRRWVLVYCVVAAALVAAPAGYGWSRMRALRPEPGPKVALVQGNVPQDLKDTPSLDGRGQIPPAPRRALQGGDRPTRGAGDLAGDDLSRRR